MAQPAWSSDQCVLETLGLQTDLVIGIRGAGSDESQVCPMGRLLSRVNPSDRLGIAVVCVPIAGGYVYRGPVAELHGLYFVAKSITGQLFTAKFEHDTDPATFDGKNMTQLLERRNEFESLIPGGGSSIDLPVSFGEDLDGNLYIVDFGSRGLSNPGFNTGEIFVVVPFVPRADIPGLVVFGPHNRLVSSPLNVVYSLG